MGNAPHIHRKIDRLMEQFKYEAQAYKWLRAGPYKDTHEEEKETKRRLFRLLASDLRALRLELASVKADAEPIRDEAWWIAHGCVKRTGSDGKTAWVDPIQARLMDALDEHRKLDQERIDRLKTQRQQTEEAA